MATAHLGIEVGRPAPPDPQARLADYLSTADYVFRGEATPHLTSD